MTRRDYRPGEGPAAGCTVALVVMVAIAALVGIVVVVAS